MKEDVSILALLAIALCALVVVSLPLLMHPERPWLGLDPPAAVTSAR